MSEQSTLAHPVFQPRPGIQGISTAYLAACLAERTVVVESGCWEWDRHTNGAGYGMIDLQHWDWFQTTVAVHRTVYRLCVEPIPAGLCVLHRCDNPSCCRPDHLFVGTNLDNIADKMAKGRQARGDKLRQHEFVKGEAVKTSRMTAEKVMELRHRKATGEPTKTLAREFGISITQAGYIIRGESWAHLPFGESLDLLLGKE